MLFRLQVQDFSLRNLPPSYNKELPLDKISKTLIQHPYYGTLSQERPFCPYSLLVERPSHQVPPGPRHMDSSLDPTSLKASFPKVK
jgi:hypothetical protein